MKKYNLTVIKEALSRVLIEEEAKTRKEAEFSPSPSNEFYSKLDEAAKNIGKQRKKSISLRRAIAVIAVAALLIGISSVGVYAFKEKIKGFVVEFFDGFAKMTVEDTENNAVDIKDVTITYVPDGFTKFNEIILSENMTIEWRNGDVPIVLQCMAINYESIFMDTENSNATEVIVADKSVFRTEKYGQLGATWTDGLISYVITCPVSVEWDEIVKMIEGIGISQEI